MKTTKMQKTVSYWNSKIITKSIKPDFTYYITPKNQLTFGGQYINYDSSPGKATAVSEGEGLNLDLPSASRR